MNHDELLAKAQELVNVERESYDSALHNNTSAIAQAYLDAVRVLEKYIQDCKECHGRREYDVLVYHGYNMNGTEETLHVKCSTCRWAQDFLAGKVSE